MRRALFLSLLISVSRSAGGDGLIVIRYTIPKSGFVLFIK